MILVGKAARLWLLWRSPNGSVKEGGEAEMGGIRSDLRAYFLVHFRG